MAKNAEKICQLVTPFENDTDTSSWEAYPRPQLKRNSYLSLCGQWELYSKKDSDETFLGSICVPFPPESRLSGICRKKEKNELYIYKKSFTLNKSFISQKVILHFGAIDQIAKVYLNGHKLGEHIGGYLPFFFEIEKYLSEGENRLTVEVEDELDTELAYGKQREKRGGMWYTPISGIWQAVWLESVPENYIKELKITSSLDSVTIQTIGGLSKKKLSLHTQAGTVDHTYSGDTFTLKIDAPKLWSPEDPHLYYFTLTDGEDTVESYFALRTVGIEKRDGISYICLNGKPYFFHGLLDQGYFPDGIYLPASPEGYKFDILTMKSLGFNMLRKHIKIEPELFYYFCDKYGMIVFQDMVNSGKYNYFLDTVIPTIGMRRGITHKATEKRRKHFESDSQTTVQLLSNHPCVCYYTIFNEGWGQYDADRIYDKLSSLDPGRIWDTTSGWFTEKKSDVKSEHIYFKKIKLKPDPNRPLVLSEFGGYSLKIEGHSFNLTNNYGYKNFHSKEELTEGLTNLYLSQVLPEIESHGLCATVLTQVSDVEDETNGLCTYDRKIIKVDRDAMNCIYEKLLSAFLTKTKKNI